MDNNYNTKKKSNIKYNTNLLFKLIYKVVNKRETKFIQ